MEIEGFRHFVYGQLLEPVQIVVHQEHFLPVEHIGPTGLLPAQRRLQFL